MWLHRLLGRRYNPDEDELVLALRKATRNEERHIEEVKAQRETGNFMTDRLVPRPRVTPPRNGGS